MRNVDYIFRVPIFRNVCSIWDHLIRQSVDHGRTVIVTTHYIEEARQANTVKVTLND